MAVYSIWESRFPAERTDEGRAVTLAIWRDMLAYDGYLDHDVVVDADDPGHFLVLSRWASRRHADAALEDYRDDPNAQRVNALVSEPRRRILATRVEPHPTGRPER